MGNLTSVYNETVRAILYIALTDRVYSIKHVTTILLFSVAPAAAAATQLHVPKLNSSFIRSRQRYRLLLGRAGYTLGFATHFLVATAAAAVIAVTRQLDEYISISDAACLSSWAVGETIQYSAERSSRTNGTLDVYILYVSVIAIGRIVRRSPDGSVDLSHSGPPNTPPFCRQSRTRVQSVLAGFCLVANLHRPIRRNSTVELRRTGVGRCEWDMVLNVLRLSRTVADSIQSKSKSNLNLPSR